MRLTWTLLKVAIWLLIFLVGFWAFQIYPLLAFVGAVVIFVALTVRNRLRRQRAARSEEPEAEQRTEP